MNKEEFNYDPEKNYDEQTMNQQKLIEEEIADEQPLISVKVTFDNISKEYAKEDIVYQEKLQNLKEKYSFVRRTRGDGNCFYRAFGFAYMEHLLENTESIPKFYKEIEKSKDVLIKLGFPSFTIDDFFENYMSVLNEVKNGCSLAKLQEKFNDQSLSDYIVAYLRLLVSGQLQEKAEFYGNFITSDKSLIEFCHQEVEPMARESDHIHIIALTNALGVSVEIQYMDRDPDSGVIGHSFPEDSSPSVLLLYRPGHYDILYK